MISLSVRMRRDRGGPSRLWDDMVPVTSVALVLTALMTLSSLSNLRHMGRHDSIGRVIMVVVPEWLFWCALAPVVLHLFARSRRGRVSEPAYREVVRHLFVLPVLMGVHSLALYAWQRGFVLTDLTLPLWQGALAVARWHLSTDVLAYSALVALAASKDGPIESVPVVPTVPSTPMTRIVVKRGSTVTLVGVETIDWIEAADYCARVHAGGRSYVIRESMRSLEQRLDPRQFLRAHRSAIVNLDRIREIQPAFRGEHVIVLTSGVKVRLGRSRRAALERLLGQAV